MWRWPGWQNYRPTGVALAAVPQLMHLWDTGAQRQSDLATLFDTDSASMTRSVQRLERARFVHRRPDPTDRRATLVEPTTASNGLRERVERTWAELEAWTVENLTREQSDHLLAGLHQIETNLAGQAKHTRSARS